ncbi:MAG: S8 family serine peptidase [Chloroflexota bacterium]
MRSKLFALLAVILLLSMLAAPLSAGNPPAVVQAAEIQSTIQPPTGEKLQLQDASAEAQPFNGRYFVLFEGNSLVQSFSDDSRQIQLDTPDAQAYLNLLRREQDGRLAQINRVIGRSLQPVFRYDVVLNGFALQLSPAEAARIRSLPGVRAVIPDRLEQPLTDAGPWFIEADEIWNGNTPDAISTKGEGIVVGILDTGINFDHPSFADDADPTYTYPSTPPKGVCAVSGGAYENACNDKLIGAYSFTTETVTPEDTNGHGSHTASTVAGNALTLPDFEGVPNVNISGVAPRAQIIAYDVCDDSGCATTASVAAVQQAILDGVDVINYSISGGKTPYSDPVELAFLEAFDAGIFVAASAGNQRDEPTTDGQVNHVSPWVMTVAASSHNRGYGYWVDVVAPAGWIPDELNHGLMALPGDGLTFSGADYETEVRAHPENASGCQSFENNYFGDLGPTIALLEASSECTFFTQVFHAQQAGASGVLIYNPAGQAYPMTGLEMLNIPAAMLDKEDGEALRAFILEINQQGMMVNLSVSWLLTVYHKYYGDIKADFSFRGPSYNEFEVLKPDITAPGLQILAAVGDGEITPGSESEFAYMSGTSMSSPHVAGAAALLKALHPTWSPAAIKSALMTTAQYEGLLKEDRATPADAFDHGAGRVNLSAAARAGLILEETTANFEAADPANGGDPKALNLPGLQNNFCVASCSWTRTFKNVSGVPVSMSITLPTWMTASPSSFTVNADETQSVTFTADVSSLPLNQWTFGTVRLDTDSTFSDGTEIADLHLPVAVRAKPMDTQPPQLVSLMATQGFLPTNRQSVTFLATFSEEVKEVGADDFVTVENGGVSGSSVTSVSGSGSSYTISVDTGSGSGSLMLELRSTATIFDLADNSLQLPATYQNNFYWIDKTAPTVQSLTLLDSTPTNASEVHFSITFSEPVFGLTATDFEAVEEDGLTGSSVTSIKADNPQTYTITLLSGGPQGQLGLRLKDGTSARDEAGNTLTGLPYFDPGKTYQIDKVAPQVTSLRRLDESPTSAAQVRFEITFSEAVQGVDPADFAVVESGQLYGSIITTLAGSTNIYQIGLRPGSGNGQLGLMLPLNTTIQDAAGNPLENLPFYNTESDYTIRSWVFLYLPVVQK